MNNKTIVNIITPQIISGIGVIRISGDLSFKILDKIFYPKNSSRYNKKETHTVHYGDIRLNKKIVDEVLVILMKGPNSFTGEDIVEIQTHGNPLITKNILENLLEKGCILSEAGEFTKRAFLNGRIDLTQSEAIVDLVNANSKKSLNIAIGQLKGTLSEKLKIILKTTMEIISFLEATIDFPEDEINEFFNEKIVIKKTKEIIKKIKLLLDTYNSGKIYKEGITAALIGSPNVGKSTIFNLLSKEDRAIITNIPGTTRDSIEEKIFFCEVVINLIDTAGICNSKNIIEKIGIKKTFDVFNRAQVIFFVLDNNKKLSKEEEFLFEKLKNEKKNYIIIENKIDLQKNKKFKHFKKSILFSAKNKYGIIDLEKRFKKILNLNINEDEIFLTNIRYYTYLKRSLLFFECALEAIHKKISYDLASIDYRSAYNEIGKITGDNVNEKLLDEIFSKFCIGK